MQPFNFSLQYSTQSQSYWQVLITPTAHTSKTPAKFTAQSSSRISRKAFKNPQLPHSSR